MTASNLTAEEIPLTDRHELPDDLWRCDACGRFASRYYNFVDHSRRGCPERKSDAGLDGCGCEPEAFCSEACADRWHGGRSR